MIDRLVEIDIAARIASHLKHAKELRRIAAVLSLRQARASVIQSAVEYEQMAATLAAPKL